LFTTGIAAYATLVSTVAVGWQIYSWHRMHKTRVRVTVANAFIPHLTGGTEDVISITVINDNDHAVRVTGYGLMANDGSGQQAFFIWPVPGSQIPGTIPPHDSGAGLNPWSGMVGAPIDFNRPVKAFAVLASGERFYSEPVTLFVPKQLRAA
jgi:hypothetical protein